MSLEGMHQLRSAVDGFTHVYSMETPDADERVKELARTLVWFSYGVMKALEDIHKHVRK